MRFCVEQTSIEEYQLIPDCFVYRGIRPDGTAIGRWWIPIPIWRDLKAIKQNPDAYPDGWECAFRGPSPGWYWPSIWWRRRPGEPRDWSVTFYKMKR
jgi:hypothetical protein